MSCGPWFLRSPSSVVPARSTTHGGSCFKTLHSPNTVLSYLERTPFVDDVGPSRLSDSNGHLVPHPFLLHRVGHTIVI